MSCMMTRNELRQAENCRNKSKNVIPFRHLIRDYMNMEAEKDERQYGFLDGAVRMDNTNQAEERWVEAMKVFCTAFPYPEYAACKSQGMLMSAVDNQELRQGYLAQMLDETILHAALRQGYNLRYGCKHGGCGRCKVQERSSAEGECLRVIFSTIRL